MPNRQLTAWVLLFTVLISIALGLPVEAQIGGPPAAAYSLLVPNSSAIAAAADIQAIPLDLQPYMRYLSLYNIPAVDRPKLIETLSFMINSVSRAKAITPVYVLPHTDNSVVRICLKHYQYYDNVKHKTFGWDPAVYDKLGDLDCYFHANLIKTTTNIATTQVLRSRYVISGYYGNQPQYRVETYYEPISEATVRDTPVRASAPWCDPVAMGKLVSCTQSVAPLLRADQFLVAISLPPFYYDLLGLGNNQDDFFDMLFADEKQVERARLEARGVVVKSGSNAGVIPVARNNRMLLRLQSLLGYLWVTHDTDQNVNDFDYLRILVGEKFKATELIGIGRNGLQFYFLAQGNAGDKPKARQDEAPIAIAIDNTNHDRRVRNGRSCITCHVRGINEFKPLPQELIKHAIDIVSPLEYKAIELREKFVTNMDEYVTEDQKLYAKAIRMVNGLTPTVNANQFSRFYDQYAETDVTLSIAQYEIGCSTAELQAALQFAQNDPFLLSLSRGLPVRREHWEVSYQQAMLLVLRARQARP